jgi:hypothetical protein
VPTIVDYEFVMNRLVADGLKCNYPNGGSFGFPDDIETWVRGWIGPPDPSIRQGMRQFVRGVAEPYEDRLTAMAISAWETILPGVVWVMPGSHWSFEMDHGNRGWLPGLLQKVGVDGRSLTARTNAAAIEFPSKEEGTFRVLLSGLLGGLTSSDFTLAFPGRLVTGLVHHHKQLWWVAADQALIAKFDKIGLDCFEST